MATYNRKKVKGTHSTYIYENGVLVNEKTGFKTTGYISGNVPYRKVTVTYKDGSQRCTEMHRLVAEAFMKANWKVNEDKIVAYIDGDSENVTVENLMLTTPTKCAEHNITVLGKRYGALTNDEVTEIRTKFCTYRNPKVGIKNLAKKYNVSFKVINNVVNNVTYNS